MASLEEDFPELRQTGPKTVEVYRIGEEPPAWVEWKDATPQERLRHMELLRRINFGYDPATVQVSRIVEILNR